MKYIYFKYILVYLFFTRVEGIMHQKIKMVWICLLFLDPIDFQCIDINSKKKSKSYFALHRRKKAIQMT